MELEAEAKIFYCFHIPALNAGIHNQWRSQEFSMGDYGGDLSCQEPPEARGSGSESPSLDDFYNLSIKITHVYAYFGQNSYFKAIPVTHQKSI